jgi:hypothetical protein
MSAGQYSAALPAMIDATTDVGCRLPTIQAECAYGALFQ